MTSRPGKYIEHDFAAAAVGQVARAETRGWRWPTSSQRWWYPRLRAVWRSALLAGLIDDGAWHRLQADLQSAGDASETDQPRLAELEQPPEVWQALYYCLDPQANAVFKDQVRGKTVLDVFMGGGTVVTEALRLGADVVGLEANPVAWFAARKATEGVSPERLAAALQAVEMAVLPDVDSVYRSTCPDCGRSGRAEHTFWIRTITCPHPACGAEIPLFGSFMLTRYRRRRSGAVDTLILVCPTCGAVYPGLPDALRSGSRCPACDRHTTSQSLKHGWLEGEQVTCGACGSRHAWQPLLAAGPPRYRMVALEVSCSACESSGYKRPDEGDEIGYRQVVDKLRSQRERLNLPQQALPPAVEALAGQPLQAAGFERWTDLFNSRQLWSLARLRDAILAGNDYDAAEILLLAWAGTLEYANRLATYLPGSQWTHTVFTPRPFVPWPLTIEGHLWGKPHWPDTFLGQLALMSQEMDAARRPEDIFVSPSGRRRTRMTGDGIQPARGHRTVLQRSAGELERAALDPHSIHLAVIDPPRENAAAIACLSSLQYVWLRTALARDYPVVFSRPEVPEPDCSSDCLAELFGKLPGLLTEDGLALLCLHRGAYDAWAPSLQPVLNNGFAVRAIHAVRAEGGLPAVIEDLSRSRYTALVVCAPRQAPAHEIDWQRLSTALEQEAASHIDDLWADILDGSGQTAGELAVLVTGHCLRHLSDHVESGQSRIAYHGRPVTLAQALDGDVEEQIVGISQLVDHQIWRRQVDMWPPNLDGVTRLYLTTLLGQSWIPTDRLRWRLADSPGVSLTYLQHQQLVSRSGDVQRVVPPRKRLPILWRKWQAAEAQRAQLPLPGVPGEQDELSTIDRLHLLLALHQTGESLAAQLAAWSDVGRLAVLAQQIAERLQAGRQQQHYRELAAALAAGDEGTL